MDKLKKCLSLVLMALCCAYTIDGFSQETSETKQMIVIKKTVDQDGKETVEKKVYTGDEISEEEMDKFINDTEGAEVDLWVSAEGTEIQDGEDNLTIFTADDELLEDFFADNNLKPSDIETVDISIESNIDNGVETEVRTMTILDKDGKKYQTEFKEGGKEVKTKGPIMQFDYVPSKPKLGVVVENHTKGAHIVEVIPGSPAATAGLQEDDIIYGIGETPITNSEDLVSSLQDADDRIYVAYLRGDVAGGAWVELEPFEFKSDSKEIKKQRIIMKN